MAIGFPNLIFAWIYLGSLFALLTLASGVDLRRYVIPKWISLSILALGILGNIARGAWLGWEGRGVWLFGDSGPFLGAVDGLLFAGWGFLVGFGLFFLMWLLNVCGGGDVKLFAALGACVGGYLAIFVLIVSLPIIFLLTIVQIATAVARGNLRVGRTSSAANGKRRLSFSLPVAIAAALVLLWVSRVELNLVASLN